MLITLKQLNGPQVAVHPSDIHHVEADESDKTCKVTFKDGTTGWINEPFADVVKKVNGE